MVVQMQVLSVDSVEMAPCLLLTTESQRFLFNVGDGTQRMCMEHRVRLAKLKHVFLTELRAHTLGGLPGMVLTVSDTGKDAMHVYGPPGTQQYLTATRHFLYRPDFELKGVELQPHAPVAAPADASGSSESDSTSATTTIAAGTTTLSSPLACYSDDEVLVFGIVSGKSNAGIKRKLHESSSTSPTADSSSTANDCVSYVIETHPQRGKFLIEKAVALGVPKGQLFGQLHQGKDVTLPDGRVVKSADCVSPTLPASGCAVIACPSIEYVDELVKRVDGFRRYQSSGSVSVSASTDGASEMSIRSGATASVPEVQLAAMFHLAPPDVLTHPKYVDWVQRFGADVEHVVLSHDACPQKSVYRASATLQAQLQSVFPRAFPSIEHELRDAAEPLARTASLALAPHRRVVVGENMLKFTVTPAARRGVDASACWHRLNLDEVRASTTAVTERLESELASAIASAELASTGAADSSVSSDEGADTTVAATPLEGRITFLGTGCAIPSKYRNVTGMYLEIDRPAPAGSSSPSSPSSSGLNAAPAIATCATIDATDAADWDGLMLDCGEGSFGQLVRYADGDQRRVAQLVDKLQCIWISHNHADHHLGAVRMLSQRSREVAPVLIIGPSPVEWWLNEYAAVDPTIAGKFRFVDNYCFDELDARFEEAAAIAQSTRTWLRDALRITQFECVPVKHAFRAYALVATFVGGCKIAFSGDCRPSTQFAEKAQGALLMVHEATFEDAMGDEAKSKNHCTTAEAIDVGQRSRATHVILTHFSQRYPKMPVMARGSASDVLTAVDLLSLRFDELHQPQLMAVCAELMGTDDDDDDNVGDGN